MSLRQIYYVARREYIARVRNKAFIFMTLLVPIFLVGYIVVLPLIFSQTGTKNLSLAVADFGSGKASALIERLQGIQEPRITAAEVAVDSKSEDQIRTELSAEVRSNQIDGYILLSADPDTGAAARYFARETGNPVLMGRIQDAFRSTLLEGVLAGSGVDFDQVRRIEHADMQVLTVSKEGEEAGGFGSAFFSTLALGMLLYMTVLINGQGMAMAIVEEKSSRLIEVVLGAVTAMEFMTGKILGVLGSGLTQLGIWLVCALVALLYGLPALAMSLPPDVNLSSLVKPEIVLYFSLFFALGYLLYSMMFAAVAATCSSTEEVSQAMFPAMFPLILAFFATFYAVPNPATTATRVLSLIPLFTPLVMLARVNVLMPPLWEVWLSILLLILAIALAFWLCSKVFRFALLMHGKRPTLVEIVRMIRAA
ncbi:MAG: ABC transporter permease [Acidobacteriota bacterium]